MDRAKLTPYITCGYLQAGVSNTTLYTWASVHPSVRPLMMQPSAVTQNREAHDLCVAIQCNAFCLSRYFRFVVMSPDFIQDRPGRDVTQQPCYADVTLNNHSFAHVQCCTSA